MMRQLDLVDLVKSYDPGADEAVLNRAYVYSMKAHGTQVRASGDPYFSHPVEVAGVLAQMKLDTASIVTGLLARHGRGHGRDARRHRKAFGPDIARLVDGVTKLSRIELQSDQTKQAENFRKLVLAMSEDIRVLLVKLADRLHNMQTLRFHRERRQASPDRARDDGHLCPARRADRHAPDEGPARRSGLRRTLSGCAGEHHRAARLSARAGRRHRPAHRCRTDAKRWRRAGLPPVSLGARNRAYSIWHKMQRKDIPFEQLADVMAFRVLVDDIGQCYHALGIIHSAYHVVPGRFKDYISTPKPNNYRSLHTGVIGPERQRIEVQIRTREMHEVAELGVAAHWIYKQESRAHRRTAIPLAARAARHPRACLEPGGVCRAHQARDVSGPGVLSSPRRAS